MRTQTVGHTRPDLTLRARHQGKAESTGGLVMRIVKEPANASSAREDTTSRYAVLIAQDRMCRGLMGWVKNYCPSFFSGLGCLQRGKKPSFNRRYICPTLGSSALGCRGYGGRRAEALSKDTGLQMYAQGAYSGVAQLPFGSGCRSAGRLMMMQVSCRTQKKKRAG